MQIEGVGSVRAENLLEYFGSGSKIARAACSGWSELTNVEGMSEESSKGMFKRMIEAEVFHDLRGY